MDEQFKAEINVSLLCTCCTILLQLLKTPNLSDEFVCSKVDLIIHVKSTGAEENILVVR